MSHKMNQRTDARQEIKSNLKTNDIYTGSSKKYLKNQKTESVIN